MFFYQNTQKYQQPTFHHIAILETHCFYSKEMLRLMDTKSLISPEKNAALVFLQNSRQYLCSPGSQGQDGMLLPMSQIEKVNLRRILERDINLGVQRRLQVQTPLQRQNSLTDSGLPLGYNPFANYQKPAGAFEQVSQFHFSFGKASTASTD